MSCPYSAPFLTPGDQGAGVPAKPETETESTNTPTPPPGTEVLITLKRDGLPPNDQWREFLAQYALAGWYAASDAIAWATLAKIANSDWDETLAYADDEYVETAAQDLGDNAIEGVVVIDAETGDTLFDRTAVVRADGSQYVGMQDTEAEALRAEERESYIPLTPGQAHVVDELLTQKIGSLDRELLNAVKRDGLPPENQWNEFIAQLEIPNGEETSDAQALATLVLIASSDWNEFAPPIDSPEPTLLQEEQSEAQARVFEADSPVFELLQSDPEVIANMDVNPHEIARYGELKDFVNTGLNELQGIGEKGLIAKIGESIGLIEDVFGYTVEFHEDYVVAANVELAMEQVHNLAIILYHFLNDLGNKIMVSTPEETIYILGADERIPKYEGLVVLPESTAKGDPELKIVYLGSEIEAGTIGHEVAHEIDRRMGDYGTAKVEYEKDSRQPISELGPVGSFLWFLKNEVVNQRQPNLPKGDTYQGYHLRDSGSDLNEHSRANPSKLEREVLADSLAAKVLGPLDEPFFGTAYATAKPIGFKDTPGAADIAIALEQYYDQVATSANSPEDFCYIKYHDGQSYGELDWPVMPVQGGEECEDGTF